MCGIGGLGTAVAKSATLSSVAACPSFVDLAAQSAPIVRVAVEPKQLGSLHALAAGLQMLSRADWSVEVAQLPSGEHVLGTCGEVHLERCLHDLRTTFAPGIELVVSPPIVPLRASLAPGRGRRALDGEPALHAGRPRRCPRRRAPTRENHDALRARLAPDGAARCGSAPRDERLGAAVDAIAARSRGGQAPQGVVLGVPRRSRHVQTYCSSPRLPPPPFARAAAALIERSLGPGAAGSGPLCEEPMEGLAFVVEELPCRQPYASRRGEAVAEAPPAAADVRSAPLERWRHRGRCR